VADDAYARMALAHARRQVVGRLVVDHNELPARAIGISVERREHAQRGVARVVHDADDRQVVHAGASAVRGVGRRIMSTAHASTVTQTTFQGIAMGRIPRLSVLASRNTVAVAVY